MIFATIPVKGFSKVTMALTRDFTVGPPARQILSLALPIIGVAFIQMAYNMADIFWIGHLGPESAAATGAAGIYLWLSMSLAFLPKVGAEITISQSIGAGNMPLARRYARQTVALALAFSVVLGLLLWGLRRPLIGLFALQEAVTNELALGYLSIVIFGLPFAFLNAAYFGLYNGHGNSRVAFIANSIGLCLNFILDPLLINGYLGFPALGVRGAAIATVLAEGVVTAVFLGVNLPKSAPFHGLMRGYRPSWVLTWKVVKIGAPGALQSALFACISIVLARIVAGWGDICVAAQTVGAAIEAISYMTAGGFSSALGSFVGQNFGAGNPARIRLGYHRTLGITALIGGLASVAFLGFGHEIFGLFVPDAQASFEGGRYLQVLGVSQLFMVLEITTGGLFNGVGRTMPPAVVGVAFNLLRIPLALWWGSYSVVGVWWAITASSILKGVVLWLWHFRLKLLQKEA